MSSIKRAQSCEALSGGLHASHNYMYVYCDGLINECYFTSINQLLNESSKAICSVTG